MSKQTKFLYFCTDCGQPATKEPCAKDGQHSLGTWRCTGKCKGIIKVRRENNNAV